MPTNGEQRQQLDQLLAKCLQRVEVADKIDRDELAAHYPHLAAALAGNGGGHAAVDAGQTVAYTPQRRSTGSRGLQIRCPHCSNAVEVLVDTPYEEITCGSCGSHFSLVDREDQTRTATPLKRLGRFELISRVGVGGFGSVWKARDTELDRVVAVKIPRKGQLAPAEVEQFFREARAAAQLRHPNIVPVHEVGREGETIFIVCDLVRGVDLGDWLTVQSLSSRETAELCKKVALALHHAHQNGVVHRDLKPSNIMIDEQGEPNLMDFGLAKREVSEITMTVDGQILGTPAYMSPEQAGGRSHWTDRRTDLYSLGVIMFRLLTGELPFRGEAQMQLHQRLTEDAPDPRKLNRHIPKDLSTICLKCLERDPNRRYPTALALANEFDRFLEGRPIEARPLSRAARLARWAKRKPALATALALTVILAIVGPATALVIEAQRQRLAELVGEKDNLIKRYAVEKQQDVRRLSELGGKLDLWEGRANPWELWPPSEQDGSRGAILRGLYERQYQPLTAKLTDGRFRPLEEACSHMALATLAGEAQQRSVAIHHWSAATELLRRLSNQHPADAAYAVALADCHRQLARLADKDQAEAERQLSAASAIYAASQRSRPDPRNIVFLLETTMDAAILSGFEGASEKLVEAARLQQQLEAIDDPIELYRLTSYLTGREPILTANAPPAETKSGD